MIAGLVPFLKDNGHSFHLKMFSPEALQRQAKSRWNSLKQEADLETDAELANLLAEDDDLNFTNEPTLEKLKPDKTEQSADPVVEMEVPSFPPEHMPSMKPNDDSVSTFHPGATTINLTEESDEDDEVEEEHLMQKPTNTSSVSILRTSHLQDQEVISHISISDSETRISSLETEFSAMNKQFREEIGRLQSQAEIQAESQQLHESMLTEILKNLQQLNVSQEIQQEITNTPSLQPEAANHPQAGLAGDPSGASGQG
jgi:hypothetical protein